MQFNPPLIHYIEQVIPYIEDNPAIIRVKKDWYEVLDYVYVHKDSFPNSYARECRGMKFCASTGKILARPYGKFHNLNECKGWMTEDVDLSQPHSILDKLDGSMVHTCVKTYEQERGINKSVFLMTRMGLSDQALAAMEFAKANPIGDSILKMVDANPRSTFIFEYVGPNNRIVIPYEKEELILTGIRDIYTGEYTTMGLMAAMAAEYDIPCVGEYDYPDEKFLHLRVATDEEKEGCVIRFNSGAMVKMKSEIYVRKHKSKELTETNKGVVQLLIDDTLDDILPQLEGTIAADLQDYRAGFWMRVDELVEGLRHILSDTKDMDQKTFALHVQATFPRITQRLLFSTRKSGKAIEEIKNVIRSKYTKESELVPLMQELGIELWQS